MAGRELRKWADNFTTLRGELQNYDRTLAEIQGRDPRAAARRGPNQLIAFQIGPLLSMLGFGPGTTPAWLAAPDTVPDPEQNPHYVLVARYFLELTALQANTPPLDTVRHRLTETLDRLRDLAWKWARHGTDAAELAEVQGQARAFAEKIRPSEAS